jgi:hypothetical protein
MSRRGRPCCSCTSACRTEISCLTPLAPHRSRFDKRPGANFLELFMNNAPKEQTLKAAAAYFEGNESISILSQNPEKKSNTVRATPPRRAVLFSVFLACVARPHSPLPCADPQHRRWLRHGEPGEGADGGGTVARHRRRRVEEVNVSDDVWSRVRRVPQSFGCGRVHISGAPQCVASGRVKRCTVYLGDSSAHCSDLARGRGGV